MRIETAESTASNKEARQLTRPRKNPGETPFGAWLRSNPKLDAQAEGIYVSDIDFSLFRFRPGVLFFLEIKTHGAEVGRHQGELLSILDQTCRMVDGRVFDTLRGRRPVRFSGVFSLVLSGEAPDDSEWMRFGQIGSESYPVSREELELILNGGSEGITPDNWLALKRLDGIRKDDEAA